MSGKSEESGPSHQTISGVLFVVDPLYGDTILRVTMQCPRPIPRTGIYYDVASVEFVQASSIDSGDPHIDINNPHPWTERCLWVGPDSQYCLLREGHDLLRPGYEGHLPNVAIASPISRDQANRDLINKDTLRHQPVAPGLKPDQMTEDPLDKG